MGKFAYVITITLLLALIIITGWLVSPLFQTFHSSLVSPLPEFLRLTDNKEVRTLSLWFPFEESPFVKGRAPALSATAVLMYDLATNKILYEKEAKKRVPMASLTKVMTAIIALENRRSDNEYHVTKEALVGENSMGLTQAEVLTLEELLYGLMLPSGNDAAETLAINFPTGRDAFIQAMNDKAKALGLKDTNFTNPSGLQGDGKQYTTAYDLLVITRYALDNFPLFAKVAQTASYTIPATATHKAYYLENETNLITSYPGVKGVKTGYTPEAGLCLITYLDYKGHRIVGVLLGSQNRRQEMKELLDYSLLSQNIQPPKHN